jgi:hypothetical protein
MSVQSKCTKDLFSFNVLDGYRLITSTVLQWLELTHEVHNITWKWYSM